MDDNSEEYYAILGLSPDASMDQVKNRYKELSDACLKILELSRKNAAARPTPVDNNKAKSTSPRRIPNRLLLSRRSLRKGR